MYNSLNSGVSIGCSHWSCWGWGWLIFSKYADFWIFFKRVLILPYVAFPSNSFCFPSTVKDKTSAAFWQEFLNDTDPGSVERFGRILFALSKLSDIQIFHFYFILFDAYLFLCGHKNIYRHNIFFTHNPAYLQRIQQLEIA